MKRPLRSGLCGLIVSAFSPWAVLTSPSERIVETLAARPLSQDVLS